MSEAIRVDKDEWETLLTDTEKIIQRHSALIKKVSELEKSNVNLRKELEETSRQLQKAEEEKRAARIKIERLESDAEKVAELQSRLDSLVRSELSETKVKKESEAEMRIAEGLTVLPPRGTKAMEKPRNLEIILRERHQMTSRLLEEQ